MSRVKLSEFRAKNLLFATLQRDYPGVSVDLKDKGYQKNIERLSAGTLYVTKVDQAVKKRGNAGLVKIKRSKKQVIIDLRSFARQGFRYALVEPYIAHNPDEERYLAFLRTSAGVDVRYLAKGGVDVESHQDAITSFLLAGDNYDPAQNTTGLDSLQVKKFYDLFQKTHMTLLEINPLLITDKGYVPLDAAVEVDGAAQFFVDGAWVETDIREPKKQAHEPERVVEELNSKSPSSLTLRVLNPNGSIFLLLSGGGASVVVADELAHLGLGSAIANYGEYSGNPTTQETYIYTREILKLMFKSNTSKKVLVIAGGIANFTDVAKTFAGIIRALDEAAPQLTKHKIKVLVRRGGPNQVQGLRAMDNFLTEAGIPKVVYGPEKSLSKIVAEVAGAVK
jgi:ATP-citrate lyase beta-subunit